MKEPENVTVYIEYLNKDKNFAKDKVEFHGQTVYEADKKARRWARENLERFDPDMIRMD